LTPDYFKPKFLMDNFSHFPQLQYFTIVPSKGHDLQSQIYNCLSRLDSLLLKADFDKNNVLKQTIFVKASNNIDFYRTKNTIIAKISDFYAFPVPTTVVAQTPENNALLSMEIAVIKQPENYSITRKTFNNTNFVVLQSFTSKLLISGGQSLDIETTDILKQSQKSFEIMNAILMSEGFEFCDVFRQWNYIEKITDFTGQNDCKSQHYQIFNDVRSTYYRQSNFVNGYPAATGIGTSSGGVIIDFFALKTTEVKNIHPVKNPVQVDAHKYTHEVLEENNMVPKKSESTPKFERAKLILSSKSATLFISGTAAIKGEHTIPENNVEVQTRVTLENIQILASDDNLKNHGLSAAYKKKHFSLLRIYVKNEADIPVVKSIIDELHPHCPCKIIQSDVCRANLLVEIEGVMEFEY
jgi:enamine deaminase RidA (YjgF/YER057c/UK114 family)